MQVTHMAKNFTSLLLASTVLMLPLSGQASEEAQPMISLPSPLPVKTEQPEAAWKAIVSGQTKVVYKDNLYKAKTDKQDDLIGRIQPEAAIVSNLEKHALRITGGLDAASYASESNNNFVDGSLAANGRYDINEVLAIHANSLWRDDHVDIGSFEDDPESRNLEPTDYRYGEAGITLDVHPESYLIQLGGIADFYNYDNAKRQNGTFNINDDRDRKEYQGWTKLGRTLSNDVTIYTLAGLDQRQYDKRIDGTLAHGRDSDGRTARIGAMYGTPKDLQWFDVNMGYLNRAYDDAFYPDVTTLGFTAKAYYQLAADWGLSVNADRTVEENTLSGVSSFIKTYVQGELTHQLNHTIELAGNARFTQNEFQINSSLGLPERTDNTYDIGANARYKLTDVYKLDLGYLFTKRTSDNSDFEYHGNTVTLGLTASVN